MTERKEQVTGPSSPEPQPFPPEPNLPSASLLWAGEHHPGPQIDEDALGAAASSQGSWGVGPCHGVLRVRVTKRTQSPEEAKQYLKVENQGGRKKEAVQKGLKGCV